MELESKQMANSQLIIEVQTVGILIGAVSLASTRYASHQQELRSARFSFGSSIYSKIC